MRPTKTLSEEELKVLEMKKKQKELGDKIRELLNSDSYDMKHDKARVKAMLLINDFQTGDELNTFNTIENNGVGFNSFDAAIMSSMCSKLHDYKSLTERQMSVVRKTIRKYWRQLVYISISEYKNPEIDKLITEWEHRNHEYYMQQTINNVL